MREEGRKPQEVKVDIVMLQVREESVPADA